MAQQEKLAHKHALGQDTAVALNTAQENRQQLQKDSVLKDNREKTVSGKKNQRNL